MTDLASATDAALDAEIERRRVARGDVVTRAEFRLAHISRPPWKAGDGSYIVAPYEGLGARDSVEYYGGHHLVCESLFGANLAFVAEAPTLVRELVDEVKRLRSTT